MVIAGIVLITCAAGIAVALLVLLERTWRQR